MVVIYMPSEKCPKCPFMNVCREVKKCPIILQTLANILEINRELPQESHKLKRAHYAGHDVHELDALWGD